MTILLNVKTGVVDGAFKTELEEIGKDMVSLPIEKLNDIKPGPYLTEVKKTYCATTFYTNPMLWMVVNGKLRGIPVP